MPAGKSYLALWCRVRDGAFLDIENEAVAALDAGYGGERNVGTWRAHLRVLKDLGFIDYKAGPSGPFQFILLSLDHIIIQVMITFFNLLSTNLSN